MQVHSSSGYIHSLNEVLSDPVRGGAAQLGPRRHTPPPPLTLARGSQGVRTRLIDTKYVAEVDALERFMKMLHDSPDRAFYGPRHVFYAHEHGAVGELLLADSLFRAQDVAKRRRCAALGATPGLPPTGLTDPTFSGCGCAGQVRGPGGGGARGGGHSAHFLEHARVRGAAGAAVRHRGRAPLPAPGP